MEILRPKQKQQFNVWMALLIGIGMGLIASIFTVIKEINKVESVVKAYDYIDSAGVYTLKYPSAWMLKLEPTFIACDGPDCEERVPSIWQINSRGARFASPNSRIPGNVISVTAYTLQQAEALNLLIECEAQSRFNKVEVLKINGYDVCYDYMDWWREDNSEGIKEHTYTYRKGDYFVRLHFIERKFQWERTQDDSADLPAFRAVVRSVNILK